jgi:hypothetical protein
VRVHDADMLTGADARRLATARRNRHLAHGAFNP